jgi:hypothetical protein
MRETKALFSWLFLLSVVATGLFADDVEILTAIDEFKSQLTSIQTTLTNLQSDQNKSRTELEILRSEVERIEKDGKNKDGSGKDSNTTKSSPEPKGDVATDRLKPWLEKTLALLREQVSTLSQDVEGLKFKFQKIFDTPSEIAIALAAGKNGKAENEGLKIYTNSIQGGFRRNVQYYEDLEMEISFFFGNKQPSESNKSDPLVNQRTTLSIHIPRHYQETGKTINLTFGAPSFFAPTALLQYRDKNAPFRGRCVKCQITLNSIGTNRVSGQGQIFLQDGADKKSFNLEIQKFSVGLKD